MSVERASVKVNVSVAVCGWADFAIVSGGGFGGMDFESGFFAGEVEDWVSGRVFAARFLSLVCPGMGCGTCLSLLEVVLLATLICLGVFSADS